MATWTRRAAALVAAAPLAVVALAAPAAAAPNPSDSAVLNQNQQGCANVIGHNPNVDPDGPAWAGRGGARLLAVGIVFCSDPEQD